MDNMIPNISIYQFIEWHCVSFLWRHWSNKLNTLYIWGTALKTSVSTLVNELNTLYIWGTALRTSVSALLNELNTLYIWGTALRTSVSTLLKQQHAASTCRFRIKLFRALKREKLHKLYKKVHLNNRYKLICCQ